MAKFALSQPLLLRGFTQENIDLYVCYNPGECCQGSNQRIVTRVYDCIIVVAIPYQTAEAIDRTTHQPKGQIVRRGCNGTSRTSLMRGSRGNSPLAENFCGKTQFIHYNDCTMIDEIFQ